MCLMLTVGFSQETKERKVIQFSGVVFSSDSTNIIPGVHVYTPKSGRGTTTNPYGFFSMAALEGDSIVFSTVGYKRVYYNVPAHDMESSLRITVVLEDDITFLEEVEIRPYPTEAMFKEALITMDLPYQKEYANLYQWLNSEYMRLGYQNLPPSPNANAQYLLNQRSASYIKRYVPPTNQFLNPFAWAQFISSLKQNR